MIRRPNFYSPLFWAAVIVIAGLLSIMSIPLIRTTEIVTTTVTVQVPHEYQTTIPLEISKIKEMEEAVFDKDEVLIGWGTFAYKVYFPQLTGKEDPEIYGNFRILSKWVKDASGKRQLLDQGIPFAIFNDRMDFGVFQTFNSIDAIPDPVFQTYTIDNITYPSEAKFSFIPEPDTWYYFVFSNHTPWDREALLSVKLIWNAEVVESEVTDVTRVDMVDVEVQVPKEQEVIKSIFQLLFR
jgi:hypothetical protein